MPFALAHNGALYNDRLLRKTLKLPNTNIETDSYVAVQLIEQAKALNFNSLRHMAEKVEGSFCFTVLDRKNNLYIVKGDNPFCLVHYPEKGLYLYASTERILGKALILLNLPGTPELVELSCGDILRIDIGQIAEKAVAFWDTQLDKITDLRKSLGDIAETVLIVI